jgi:hypothetical protein
MTRDQFIQLLLATSLETLVRRFLDAPVVRVFEQQVNYTEQQANYTAFRARVVQSVPEAEEVFIVGSSNWGIQLES